MAGNDPKPTLPTMITLLFHAKCVAAENNEFGWTVGFADQEFETERYLQIQRSHSDGAQEAASGMDTYYIERDDQSNSGYGGVQRIELREQSIDFTFDSVGREQLHLERDIRISFDADAETASLLKDGLRAVFQGAGTVCLGLGE